MFFVFLSFHLRILFAQNVYLVVKCLVSVQDKLSLVEIVVGPESMQQSNASAFRSTTNKK